MSVGIFERCAKGLWLIGIFADFRLFNIDKCFNLWYSGGMINERVVEKGRLSGRVQKYVNVEEHGEAYDRYADVVEVKYDGWWARCVFEEGEVRVYSRQGQLKYEGRSGLDCKYSGVIVGEYLVGTQRATSGEGGLGKVMVFDVLEIDLHNGTGIEREAYALPWNERRELLEEVEFEGSMFELVPTFPIEEAEEVWEREVEKGGGEGLIYKRSDEPYVGAVIYRKKQVFTMDYVVMGVEEGGGRNEGKLGALVCGLYVEGELVKKVRVGGGFTDAERQDIWDEDRKYIGRVIEVKGWQLFESGAMRHPNAVRGADGLLKWRDDKAPEECVWCR